ncbi:MAG: aldolase/citrate lyase family protein, partial [Halobacteria archaeon]
MKNTTKEKLRRGEVVIGAVIGTCNLDIVEIMSRMNFDWLWFDTEHSPLNAELLQPMLQVARGGRCTPIVRVAWNDQVLIKKALDVGAYGLIIPWINNRAQAEAAVRASKYPPQGLRGFGPRWVATSGGDRLEYTKTANDEILIIAQIETREALDNLEEILTTPGIDAYLIGPNDLAASLGHLGDIHHPEVEKAIENIELPEHEKINVRIRNLPSHRNIRIRNLRAKHINKLVEIEGVVKAASEVKPQIYEAIFQCPECGNQIAVEQKGVTLKTPVACDCGRKGVFKLIDTKKYDIRWLTLEEPYEITSGERPGKINVLLKEDLTTPEMQRKTDPGNQLKIVGILREIQRKIQGKVSTRPDIYFDAIYLEPKEEEFEDIQITEEDRKKIEELAKDPNIYDILIDSLAPSIYGWREIKEAILLQLFGGVRHKFEDGTYVRGNIHILITGDPSTAKSVLLSNVVKALPRGRYVSGKGVTGSGLTTTVIKNELLGGWVLEAGALVLANKSILAIDEFDKMNKDDQIAMHEAMSLETISIAKANIVATLPAQTSVLAASNPKLGRFDPLRSIVDQVAIPETLLSRFDLKFALRDV